MRRPTDWNDFRYFSADGDDNWGDASKMDYNLIAELDSFRDYLKQPIIVSSGYRNWGPTTSMHRFGKAVDVVFPKRTEHLLDIYFKAERFGFTGIGVYKYWSYKNREVGGLHLDNRQGRAGRWIGFLDENKVRNYIELTIKNLEMVTIL